MARPVATVAVVNEDRILEAFARNAAQMDDIASRLARLDRHVAALMRATAGIEEQITHDLMEETLMSDLSTVVADLETEVAANTNAIESAATAFGTLGAKVLELQKELDQALANTGTVPQEMLDRLSALGTVISDEDGKLSAAVTANTPAAPPAPA